MNTFEENIKAVDVIISDLKSERDSLRALVVRMREALSDILKTPAAGFRMDVAGVVSALIDARDLVPADLADCVVVKRGEWARKDSLIAKLDEYTAFLSRVEQSRAGIIVSHPYMAYKQEDIDEGERLRAELAALRPEAKGGA